MSCHFKIYNLPNQAKIKCERHDNEFMVKNKNKKSASNYNRKEISKRDDTTDQLGTWKGISFGEFTLLYLLEGEFTLLYLLEFTYCISWMRLKDRENFRF